MLFCIIILNLSAQDFKAGISGGTNASWLSNISDKGYQLWTLQAGLFTQINTDKKSSWRFEMRYSKEGNHVMPQGNGDYTIILHYIDIPVSYIYHFSWEDLKIDLSYQPYITAGIAYGHLIDASEGFGNSDVITEPFHPFKMNDFSIHVGLGGMVGKHFSAELRYSISIVPIREDFNDNAFVLGNQRNNVVSGNVYYTF